MIHFTPAIASPFAASHIDYEVAIIFVVVYPGVVQARVVRTRSRGETVDHALRQEASMLSNPRLRSVQLLKGVLFLVFPLHVLLLIQHRVPPDIQKLFGPVAASDEERAKVES